MFFNLQPFQPLPQLTGLPMGPTNPSSPLPNPKFQAASKPNHGLTTCPTSDFLAKGFHVMTETRLIWWRHFPPQVCISVWLSSLAWSAVKPWRPLSLVNTEFIMSVHKYAISTVTGVCTFCYKISLMYVQKYVMSTITGV